MPLVRFQDKTQENFSPFLTIFMKLIEIYLILVFVYSLNFLDFLCISFKVDAIDKRFKVFAPAVLQTFIQIRQVLQTLI